MKRTDFLKRSAVIGGAFILFKELPSAEDEAFAETLTPMRQGSTTTVLQGVDHVGKNYDFGFQRAIDLPWKKENFDPVLLRRSMPMKPALSFQIEEPWGWNQTQIFRTPFAATMTQFASRHANMTWWAQVTRQALKSHLKSVEYALEWGARNPGPITHINEFGDREIYVPHVMGGAKELLGRLPRKRDTFTLRPLRDLQLLTWRNANDTDERRDEWLSEITLEAHR
jgi:hypothetical protein